jgi:hypothetical protein
VSESLSDGGFELTLFGTDGLLTKRISLDDDGRLISDGSACVMARGTARRVLFDGLKTFAACIGGLLSNQAIALGALRPEVPEEVSIVTKDKLAKLNGSASPDTISRSGDYLHFEPGRRALGLIDYDMKGMPPAVAARVRDAGGPMPALTDAFPALGEAGRVVRSSTSAGIRRIDTGADLPGSGGIHMFPLVQDGRDIERWLRVLHERAWLMGYGWKMVGASGQLLERSIVDRMVGAPERLVFEGPPELVPPLEQDQSARQPLVFDGPPLDTRSFLDLTLVERAALAELRRAETARLKREADQARSSFIAYQAERIITRTECTREAAERIVERQIAGVLLPDVVLPFDTEELAGSTVGDVIRDPTRFVGATLADPLEGVDYGQCKAKIMRRDDGYGTLWINSFAHGRTTYELKCDAKFIEAAIDACEPKDANALLVRLIVSSAITADEEIALRDLCGKKSDTKPRPLSARIKAARQEQAERRAEAAMEAFELRSRDRRISIPVPSPDAERLPILAALDDVLGLDNSPSRVMRDLEGYPVEVRVRPPASALHELTSDTTNIDDDPDKSRLPAPAMPLLTRHNRLTLAQKIEQHIEWVTEPTRYRPPEPVALPSVFIDHYIAYRNSKLPVVSAVLTAPLVLPGGRLLAPDGLVEQFQWYFSIDPALRRSIPNPEDCTVSEAAAALDYLANVFLIDVKTSFEGKCVLIAMMLTIIQRTLLPQRPAFFVTAAKRGGGKTTTLMMLVMALTGKPPPAAAWSTNEEERRKAMLAYLREGIQFVVWDNILRGTRISCPTIEKVLTSDTYSDRILSES